MKASFSMPYTESGITLDFPDNNYFCFENCDVYRKYSGNHFKEMDACWIDVKHKIFYIIELKDHSGADLDNKETKNAIVWKLIKKTIDSYTMLLSVLLPTPKSLEMLRDIPVPFDKSFQFKLIHIINSSKEQKAGVQFMRDSFNAKIMPYKELLNFSYCSLMTYDQAKKIFDWIK